MFSLMCLIYIEIENNNSLLSCLIKRILPTFMYGISLPINYSRAASDTYIKTYLMRLKDFFPCKNRIDYEWY